MRSIAATDAGQWRFSSVVYVEAITSYVEQWTGIVWHIPLAMKDMRKRVRQMILEAWFCAGSKFSSARRISWVRRQACRLHPHDHRFIVRIPQAEQTPARSYRCDDAGI